MHVLDKGFNDILSSQIVSLAGGLVAGTLLALYTNQLLLIPAIFLILPGFLEMWGNVSGTFASRLSSGLFLGVVNPQRMHTKAVAGNLVAAFCLALVVSVVLGCVAFLFNRIVFGLSTYQLLVIPVIAGIIASVIVIPLTLIITFALFRRGHDPNNIMGPLITSLGDVVSVLALLIAFSLVIL